MAAEHWLRWHHGTVVDPKWRVVARRASHAMSRDVTVAAVLSVWACMLECASQANPRGQLDGWDDEDIAVALGLETQEVAAIREAMQGKTLDGLTLSAWNARQPKQEDLRAKERKRAQRERQRGAVTKSEQDKSHDMSRDVTTETETETETDKKKQEQNTHTLASLEDSGRERPEVRACVLVRQLGAATANPSHPELLAALGAGGTPEELAQTYTEAVALGKAKPWPWAMATVRSRHEATLQPRASPVAGARKSTLTDVPTDTRYEGTPDEQLPAELRSRAV